MDVTFDVTGTTHQIPENQATVLAENLRIHAHEQPGGYGSEGARAVADLIEDILVGTYAGTVPLEGEAATAVYYSLNVTADREQASLSALYKAVRAIHHQRLEQDG